MAEKRITDDMSIMKAMATISDGDPGAVTCLVQIANTNPMAAFCILWFDCMEIYGSKIYKFWNDCCDCDINKLNETIQYLKAGNVSKEQIHENLNCVCAVPFI